MAEKSYEFKDMATVDLVEAVADTANVLIEEDGVIKRAPKSEVGGKTEWDAVIALSSDSEGNALCELISGNYNSLKSQIENNEVPNVLITGQWSYGDIFDIRGKSISCYYNTADGSIVIHTSFLWYNVMFTLVSDGILSSTW